MFRKHRLKRAIKRCRKAIDDLEKKRARSQAALVAAILNNTDPDDADVDYFNKFTKLIESTRDRMHSLSEELSKL